MLKRCFYLLLLLSNIAWADPLPAPVITALQQARIPLEHTGVVVWDTKQPQAWFSLNAQRSFNPASTMKLVTSYAALSILGPAYTWPTAISIDGSLHDGILDGNLYIKGYGDPGLNIERYWLLIHQLRQRDLRQINGELIIDQSFFLSDPINPDSAFDDHPRRAYNAKPSAVMVNFNSTSINLFLTANTVQIKAEPLPIGAQIINQLILTNQPCNEWRDHIHTEWQADTQQLTISGQYSVLCGDKSFALTLNNPSALVASLFTTLWQNEGGKLQGAWHIGSTPSNAQLFMTYHSPPLVQAVYELNKFSNNVMARNLFLSLDPVGPASTVNSGRIINDWLHQQNLHFPELVLENGAGLSRLERISPDSMAQLLRSAYQSPVYPELASSLPIVAVDGTMKKRGTDNQVANHAHIKTGTLDGVKTMAGYVTTQAGNHVVVVFFINDDRAAFGNAAQDALLEWVYLNR